MLKYLIITITITNLYVYCTIDTFFNPWQISFRTPMVLHINYFVFGIWQINMYKNVKAFKLIIICIFNCLMVSLLPHELHKFFKHYFFMICSGEHKLFTSPHTKERLIQRINLLFCVLNIHCICGRNKMCMEIFSQTTAYCRYSQ